jgi:hypothetical protein
MHHIYLCVSCPRARIRHFSKHPWFIY